MIRRAFLRRMASAAMAGMLGLELVSRAPKMVSDPSVIRHYSAKAVEGLEPGHYIGYLSADEMTVAGTMVVTDIDPSTNTITVKTHPEPQLGAGDYVFSAT